MLRAAALIAALSLALPAAAESAEEKTLGPASRTALDLVIYNGGFAMVRDRRSVELEAGANRIAISGVSRSMDRASAILRAGDATVLAQLFDFDLLTPDRLLQASVGEEVDVIVTNPETGVETVKRAKVLAIAGGPVLEIDGRIETGIPGRLAFDRLPEGVRAAPSLVADLSAPTAGNRMVELGYLSGDIDWSADYVAEISDDGSTLLLESWATLSNMTDSDFDNASVSLVSGAVNRSQPPQQKVQPMMMRSEAMATADAAPGGAMPEREGLGDYHLYRLDGTVSLGQRESRKIALSKPAKVASDRRYVFRGGQHYYGNRFGEQRQSPAIEIRFTNEREAGLGEPLPEGTVRLYQRDRAGLPVFIGEDRISRTPENQEVTLRIGQAFDVTAKRVQTEFDRRKDSLGNVVTTAFEFTISNAGSEPVEVEVEERLYGDWNILESSEGFEKVDAFRIRWSVKVPAGGDKVLSWRARVR
jgi:hypothetical protein